MTFFKPDIEKFECVRLAYDALRRGGTAPTILNAANEVAVGMFLEKKIRFERIPAMIRHALSSVSVIEHASLEDILATDHETRAMLSRIDDRVSIPG